MSDSAEPTNPSITIEDIESAQKEWAQSILMIGKAFRDQSDYQRLAKQAVLKLYDYSSPERTTLFKPTRAAQTPFRDTLPGAISYFAGGDPDFAEDTGFALEPWQDIKFDNNAFSFQGDITIAMGKYFFKKENEEDLIVEYTLGYRRDKAGVIKIFLHHSSLPFNTQIKILNK